SHRRRHTRSKRDWSSDVCSSDLAFPLGGAHVRYVAGANGADAAETAENGSSGGQDDLFLLSLVTRVRTRPARCAYANGFSVRVYFVCRYSWIPSAPPSRPTPDCFHPPKGAAALEITPMFSPIIPVASRSIIRWPRVRSSVYT